MLHAVMARAAAPCLVLLAGLASVHAYYFLREQQFCGLGHHGTRTGTPQNLVVTHMTPGVADWNIAVPMPPACKDAQVTGVDTHVCDLDVPPDVTMNDMVSARVHRKGQLQGYATVNVTVYCIPPEKTVSTSPAPDRTDPDERSTDEVLSNELISNEVTSNEDVSNEMKSSAVKPISSVVIPLKSEVTTPLIEVTSTTDRVTTTLPPKPSKPPKPAKQLDEVVPPSYQVMIQIMAPTYGAPENVPPQKTDFLTPQNVPSRNQWSDLPTLESTQHPKNSSQYERLPLNYIEKPQKYKWVPKYYDEMTAPDEGVPPRINYKGAPQNYIGAPPLHKGAPLLYKRPPPEYGDYDGMPPQYPDLPSQYREPYSEQLPQQRPRFGRPALGGVPAMSPDYAAMSPMLNMMPPAPYLFTTMFRPLGLPRQRVTFLTRHRPFPLFRRSKV